MEFPHTLKLQEPIPFGSAAVEALTFRKPTYRDFFHVRGTPSVEDLAQTAARLTSMPIEFLGRLSIADGVAVTALVASFFESSPPTATPPS